MKNKMDGVENMKIDVKEISKISLEENELLLINVSATVFSLQDSDDLIEQLGDSLPDDWKDRIIISYGDSIKFSKIVKK